MSFVIPAHPPRAGWRHRIAAFSCTLTLAATGLVALAAPAHAAAGMVAYVANTNGQNILEVDTSSNSIVRSIPINGYAHTVAVNAGGTEIYADNSAGGLLAINASTGEVTSTIPASSGAFGFALNRAGTQIIALDNINSNTASLTWPEATRSDQLFHPLNSLEHVG